MGSTVGMLSHELEVLIAEKLTTVNYYRLSAYWYQFRQKLPVAIPPKRSKAFVPGTCWETVWAYYEFDRQLRNLLFGAISRIEIALREKIAFRLAERCPQSSNPQNVMGNYKSRFTISSKGNDSSLFRGMMRKVDASYQSSKSESARHYRNAKHVAHASGLPVWVFMEFATFGNLNMLISIGLKKEDIRILAGQMGFRSADFFSSAVALLHQVRNACAHQGRIWNRKWVKRASSGAVSPILKTPDSPAWKYLKEEGDLWSLGEEEEDILLYSPFDTATVLLVCHTMLQAIAPENRLREDLFALVDSCPVEGIAREMGFCAAGWQGHPLWR